MTLQYDRPLVQLFLHYVEPHVQLFQLLVRICEICQGKRYYFYLLTVSDFMHRRERSITLEILKVINADEGGEVGRLIQRDGLNFVVGEHIAVLQ